MTQSDPELKYPRRRVIRRILQGLAAVGLGLLTDLEVVGRENIPAEGPLIVVANHFSFLDVVAMVRTVPWPMDFIGGTVNPGAPAWTAFVPKLWGFYPVHRGTGSTYALRAASAVLAQGGVMGVYPEGGNWAQVLRPARPGAAYLAARTGAPILPIGLDGLISVFPRLRRGRRAKVTVRFGEKFGPFRVTSRGRERRQQLDEIGHNIMRRIAALISPERRGHYSNDPKIRAAAQGTEIYPWAAATEKELSRGEHL